MFQWFRQLDELLRGRITSPERLVEGRVELSLRRFVVLAVLLGATYGFFMGWYALSLHLSGMTPEAERCWQAVATMVKLPALFLLTLVVTFPSLYVFNALVGCRLSFAATLRLLVGTVVVNVAVAASLGPILGFFTLSTTSYSFIVLLNVILMAIAGLVALAFLLHTLRRLAAVSRAPWPAVPVTPGPTTVGVNPASPAEPLRNLGPLEHLPVRAPEQALGQARTIFHIWVLIYGLVGAQMGWLLRPFIGDPHQPFAWLRAREGNFFQAVSACIQSLLGGQ
jgi:hypothetical protein